ncbi:MAG: MFS transporter [Sphingomonas sp.]
MAAPGAARQDIEGAIDAIALTRTQWAVFLLCALMMFVDGFDLQVLSLTVPFMARDWGVAPQAFSLAFSAGPVAMGIGGGLFAPFGDRIGRKPMLVAALLLVGASTLAIAFAATPMQVAAWRLPTGIGMGIASVNALSLTGEYAPARRRFLIMSLMTCNMAFGAFVSAMVAPALLADHGWRALFVVGGLAAVALGAAVAAVCPESIKWLLVRRPGSGRIAAISRRLLPGADPASLFAVVDGDAGRRSIFALFAPQHRTRTLVIWLACASGGFSLYLMMSWLPTLLIGAGWSDGAAMHGAAAIQLGGIFGSLVMAYAVDRGRLLAALLCGYAGAGASLLAIALLPGGVALWTALFVLIGAGTAGMQIVWIAIATIFFPLDLRATSAGWTSAVSRIGAVSAPFAGGAAMAAGVGASGMMLGLVVPVGLSAAALLLARRHFLAVPGAAQPLASGGASR